MVGFNRFDVTVQMAACDKNGEAKPIQMRMRNAKAEDLQLLQDFQDMLARNLDASDEENSGKLEIGMMLHRFWNEEEGNPVNPNVVSASQNAAEEQPAPEQNSTSDSPKEEEPEQEPQEDPAQGLWNTLKASKRAKGDFWNFASAIIGSEEKKADQPEKLLMTAVSGYVVLNPNWPEEQKTLDAVVEILEKEIPDIHRMFFNEEMPKEMKIAMDAYEQTVKDPIAVRNEARLHLLEKLKGGVVA